MVGTAREQRLAGSRDQATENPESPMRSFGLDWSRIRSEGEAPAGGWSVRLNGRLPALLLLLLLLLTACASSGGALTRPRLETLPNHSPLRISTLSDGDAWLRHYLVEGNAGAALKLLGPDAHGTAVDDELLRALQHAVVLRHAGEFQASNDLLEWAEKEAEQRRVRSISRTAGSFLVSDGILSYVPSSGEAAMIPYYRMMNYLAIGEVDAAAVEARRLSLMLLDSGDGGVRQCREDGMLQYVAALVFEAAGDRNDALVSLRQADRSFAVCPGARAAAPRSLGADLLRLSQRLGVDEVADSAAVWYPEADVPAAADGSGEVLLLLERGFVSHRAESAIHVPIFDHEIEELETGETDQIVAAAARVTARLVNNFAERGYWGSSWDDHVGVQVAQALSGAHILKLAWPTMSDVPSRSRIRVVTDTDTLEAVSVGDLSAVAARELEESRTAMLGRLVTRGVSKYLVSRELEQKAEEKGGELLGFLTARVANLAANETERADTRSWTLLPDDIALVRLALPAGEHDITVQTVSASGQRLRSVQVPALNVRAGTINIASHRIWIDNPVESTEVTHLDEG